MNAKNTQKFRKDMVNFHAVVGVEAQVLRGSPPTTSTD
jgi:hypothetical protein